MTAGLAVGVSVGVFVGVFVRVGVRLGLDGVAERMVGERVAVAETGVTADA
jgi:hypothetical protein